MMIMETYMFLVSLVSLVLNRKHVLAMLLSLELVVLILFFTLYMNLMNFNFEMYFIIIFLTINVCESALGLSLMISMIRTYGNDYFSMLNLLW